MTIERFARALREWIAAFGTIRQQRTPDDLRRLGMRPQDFLSLGHG